MIKLPIKNFFLKVIHLNKVDLIEQVNTKSVPKQRFLLNNKFYLFFLSKINIFLIL